MGSDRSLHQGMLSCLRIMYLRLPCCIPPLPPSFNVLHGLGHLLLRCLRYSYATVIIYVYIYIMFPGAVFLENDVARGRPWDWIPLVNTWVRAFPLGLAFEDGHSRHHRTAFCCFASGPWWTDTSGTLSQNKLSSTSSPGQDILSQQQRRNFYLLSNINGYFSFSQPQLTYLRYIESTIHLKLLLFGPRFVLTTSSNYYSPMALCFLSLLPLATDPGSTQACYFVC